MNMSREEAFTLIEVIVAITVFTIVLGALFNILINGWNFWDINQESVDLSQATTLISANLDKNIRSARYTHVNLDYLILYIGSGNDTAKENYLKYSLESGRLLLSKPVSDPGDYDLTGITWEPIRYITDDIVTNVKFNLDGSLIEYSITFESDYKTIIVNNKIKPRL